MHPKPLVSSHAAQMRFLALAPLALGILSAATPPASTASSAPKTHVLFMGVDVSAEKNKTFHPVENVTGNAVVIKPGGKAIEVPLIPNPMLHLVETLKVSDASVEIAKLTVDRAFTPEKDPMRKFARTSAIAASQGAVADLAQGDAMQKGMMIAMA